ncbi:MAG: YidC/Oxa1 family insertase periplasmic-domain containing protein [Planctomycetes bacterium]|nr:YidC/Oxa1 family insertase periplasmic-domain containing protein [Planctomycetota bacterium]
MTPQSRRRLIPFIVFALAASVLLVIIFGSKRAEEKEALLKSQEASVVEQTVTEDKPAEVVPKKEQNTPLKDSVSVTQETKKDATEIAPFEVLSVLSHDVNSSPIILGALDDIESWQMEVHFTHVGAGISSIRFSNIFETVDGKLAWKHYRKDGGTQPPIDDLYLLTSEENALSNNKSVLCAFQLSINDQKLPLNSAQNWELVSKTKNSVTFIATVIDAKQNKIASVNRTWTLNNQYGLHLEQSVQNLTSQDIVVRWLQYGPPSLTVDRSRYMDRRRFRFGWELSDEFDPGQAAPIQSNDFFLEFTDVTKEHELTIWPTDETIEDGFKLSWFASTNRYFALAVFPNINNEGEGNRVFTNKVEKITSSVEGVDEEQLVFTGLWGPETRIAGSGLYDISMGVYAGPLKRSVLDTQEPYIALNMRDLVLYQMSSMCAICTFQWLADFLAVVLTTLDQYVVFDWGIAIVLLVLIVRGILHPITKKSQINMQRFGKVMQKLKPEIDKLKKKFPDDPKRVQREQMALMQKYGVNPFQMLGCLPMFLQMPIWVALYALLYFMFDIRQEPAFFGVFQLIGEWPFLADLSSADHFFGKFSEPKQFLFWNITGINILPILMGAIFFVQQKYMSPQSMATSPEQESQQKIMRVMMVVLFPVMLYSAPSGLTLYILTSSSVGILESRRIRKHIENIPIEPKPEGEPSTSRRKIKDKQGRAWSDAMDARRKKVQNKAKKRTFKKRD